MQSVLREEVVIGLNMMKIVHMLLVTVKSKRLSVSQENELLFGIDKLNVPRSSVPAITHVDYSARIQTVHADTNPFICCYYKIQEKTGYPLVVNTSFNVR